MHRLSIPRFGLVAVVMATLAAAAAAFAISSDAGHSATGAAPAATSPLAQNLSVLRTAPERLDPAVVSAATPRSAQLGLQLDHAQRVDTVNGPVWIVPGTDVVCAFYAEGDAVGGGCADADRVAAEGLVLGSRPAPDSAAAQGLSADAQHLVALVPDDVRALKVTSDSSDGSQTLAAGENVAVGTVNAAPTRGWLVDASGSTVGVPLR